MHANFALPVASPRRVFVLAGFVGLIAACGNGAGTPDAATTASAASFGPFGGYVTALANDPQATEVFYAGTWGGAVFKSLDAGASWVELGEGLPIFRRTTLTFPSVVSIAVGASALYAGTDGDGVFRSADGGAHWIAANTGLPEQSIARVRSHPQPDTLYAAISLLGGRGGVYRTRDGGASWHSVLGDEFISDVAVDPSDPRVLYAVAPDRVFKSVDDGQSWQTLTPGPLPANTWFDNVNASPQHLRQPRQRRDLALTLTRPGDSRRDLARHRARSDSHLAHVNLGLALEQAL